MPVCQNNYCTSKCYGEFCFRHKPRKPLKRTAIKKRGKRSIEYEKWRKEEAIPYLDSKYGRVCAACNGTRCGNINLDVDHKKGRGSHPHLRMTLTNVQYLGRYPCHYEKTNGIS